MIDNKETCAQKTSFEKIEKKFFSNENHGLNQLPNEGLRILKDKLKDIRSCSTIQNYEHNLDEALDDLSTFYYYLDTNPNPICPWEDKKVYESLDLVIDEDSSRREKASIKFDVQGRPRKLWLIYPHDVFTSGTECWNDIDQPGYFVYTPFVIENVDDCASTYLDKQWIRHPYISWSLINIYLIHTARLKLLEYDQQYERSDLEKFFFIKSPKRWSVVGSIYDEVLESDLNYNAFVLKVKRVYPRATIVFMCISIIICAMMRYLTDHYVLANVFLCLGLIWSLWDLKYSVRFNNQKLSDINKMRNILIALKEAWVTANCETVDLTRIKEQVFIVERLGCRYPKRFHALLTNTVTRYGNTLSVKTWVGR